MFKGSYASKLKTPVLYFNIYLGGHLLVLAFLVAIMVKKRATSDSHMPYLDQREKDRIAQILKKYS